MSGDPANGPMLVAGGGIGGLTAAVALRRAGFEVQVFERAAEILRESLLRLFGDWHAPIRELIAATPENAILRTDVLHRHPVRRWGRGRVTLLGDAAHPLTPNLGQGACLAIEDAVVLAGCLRVIPDPAAALRRYEDLRRPRTAGIARRAFHLGWIGQWQSAPLCRLRDRLVAWTPDAFHRLQMRHLFRFAYDEQDKS